MNWAVLNWAVLNWAVRNWAVLNWSCAGVSPDDGEVLAWGARDEA